VLAVAPALLAARAGALGAGLIAGGIGLLGRGSPRRAVIPWPASALKWTTDMVVAVGGLIVAVPLLAFAGLLIKLDSPGPVLFVQTRIGQNGKPFRMYKLRTMVPGAESMFDRVAVANALKGPAVKLPQDPRVTRVGRWLRRWSVDELPQLWNVLRRDMSLVGPRPEEPRIVAQYNDWHRQRLAVKPGLTGPMQVHGRAHLSLDERVRLEIDYIEHYAIWRDVTILLRSIPAVISGRGAY
jgi:lipopolysaccharide/colanic/teichoic acid biosynthesis glycosyltransferase